ncbi:DUF2250 domain-containing protein [Tardisphaera miroshnichenkoae]
MTDQRLLAIALHLEAAGIDYPYSIAKRNGMPMDVVEELIAEMASMGLVERSGSSSVKKSDDAFKKSSEVHKHHTYFALTELGEKALREVKGRARAVSRGVSQKDIRAALKSGINADHLEKLGIAVRREHGMALTPFGELVLWYSRNGGDEWP